MGAYGSGGASSYAFASYTVFISRRNPALLAPGQADEVGWTIVRYNPLNEDRFSKTGVYQYLVLPGDPGPSAGSTRASCRRSTATGTAPTKPTTIDYRLGRYSGAAAWEPKESIYVLGNAIMFDPVMPFLLRDERPKSVERTRATPSAA